MTYMILPCCGQARTPEVKQTSEYLTQRQDQDQGPSVNGSGELYCTCTVHLVHVQHYNGTEPNKRITNSPCHFISLFSIYMCVRESVCAKSKKKKRSGEGHPSSFKFRVSGRVEISLSSQLVSQVVLASSLVRSCVFACTHVCVLFDVDIDLIFEADGNSKANKHRKLI